MNKPRELENMYSLDVCLMSQLFQISEDQFRAFLAKKISGFEKSISLNGKHAGRSARHSLRDGVAQHQNVNWYYLVLKVQYTSWQCC